MRTIPTINSSDLIQLKICSMIAKTIDDISSDADGNGLITLNKWSRSPMKYPQQILYSPQHSPPPQTPSIPLKQPTQAKQPLLRRLQQSFHLPRVCLNQPPVIALIASPLFASICA